MQLKADSFSQRIQVLETRAARNEATRKGLIANPFLTAARQNRLNALEVLARKKKQAVLTQRPILAPVFAGTPAPSGGASPDPVIDPRAHLAESPATFRSSRQRRPAPLLLVQPVVQ